MHRRTFLKATGGLAAGTALAGCSSGETGTLATHASDQPGDIDDFETLLIQISGIRVKPEDADLMELDASAEVDLTELVGEASELVDETELEADRYEFLMLEAEATEASLTQGGAATVTVPGEAPLKFNKAFDIRAGQTTTFIADFTPIKQGRTDRYVLKPVADEVEVIYKNGTQTE